MAMARFDRISSLPDGILCHVLSFLPAKQAVATSVLSKRWNPLWLAVPALRFDDGDTTAETYYGFEEFVYAVLLSRAATTLPIKKFCFICRSAHGDPSNHLRKWVTFVLQREVERLKLETSAGFNLRLPDGILSCRTLVSLKLCGFCVNDVSFSGLPLLKTLRLECLRFPKAGHFSELLSACPILENLDARGLENEDDTTFTFAELRSLSKLASGSIIECSVDFPLKAIPNVEYLQFDIYKVDPDYNDTPTFHNLFHVDLLFKRYNWHFVVEVLKHCPKLQILVLDNEANKNHDPYWDDPDWVYPESVPEHPLLHLRTCTLKNYQGMKGELQFARYIMQNASVLWTMEIYSTLDSNSDAKLEMIKNLSLLERRSATCRLSFE